MVQSMCFFNAMDQSMVEWMDQLVLQTMDGSVDDKG
jgi:hypothetical protein